MSQGILVRGTVKTQTSDKPVPNVELAASSSYLSTYTATTDAKGNFEVRVPAGEIEIGIQRVGATSVRLWQSADDRHRRRTTQSAPRRSCSRLRCAPSGSTSRRHHCRCRWGTGEGSQSSGIANPKRSLITDASGRFAFEQDAVVGDPIIADKSGSTCKDAYRVTPGQTPTLKLDTKAAVIQGQITDHDGKPLVDAEVTLGGELDKQYMDAPAVKTDQNGRYRFEGLFGGADSFFLWTKEGRLWKRHDPADQDSAG